MEWIEEFIDMLFPIDSKRLRIEEAYRLKEKYLPKSIFKYRAVNEYSLKNLEDDTIWLSSPFAFNDPYDCSHTIDSRELMISKFANNIENIITDSNLEHYFTTEQIENIKASQNPMADFMDHMLDEFPEEHRGEIKIALLKAIDNEYERMIRYSSENSKDLYKICSFSERSDSLLMWAHYADYHKGFCINYDLSVFKYGDYITRFLYPVIYSDQIFDITESIKKINTDSFNNIRMTLSSLVKARDWEYEKEWRIIFAHGILSNEQSYKICKPKCIYLGAKISDSNKSVLLEICQRKRIDAYIMKLDARIFKMIPILLYDSMKNEIIEKVFA